ncbi:MAG: hypothetical protein FWG82_01945, partial [Oscillospiraceae bacterium]|nr:hypothetical protein [Oscillospiraceae bacterium]
TVASTCTVAGKQTRSCSTCDSTETVDASLANHTYGSWTTTLNAACTTTGSRERFCSVCQYRDEGKIAALGHRDEDADGICDVCEQPTNFQWSFLKCCAEHESDGANVFVRFFCFMRQLFSKSIFGVDIFVKK